LTAENELPPEIDKILLDEATIAARVSELAGRIDEDYAQLGSLVLVGVLKGAFVFLADLARRLRVPHQIDFIALSSYDRGSVSSGEVRLLMDTRVNLTGRHVLIVEDIVDTGYTLHYLLRGFHARLPASLRSCVLLSKPGLRQIDVAIDYLGFEIPDVWVVGYGLDYDERFRTLPFVGSLEPAVLQKGAGSESDADAG
jgi:hypoxanthine phosphoribosyltransferase